MIDNEEFTPGPWLLLETQGLMNVPIIDIYQASTSVSVCQIANSIKAAKEIPADSIDANARLIGKSPEMYAFVKRSLQHMENLHGEDAYGSCRHGSIVECDCGLADDYREALEIISEVNTKKPIPA